MAVPKKRTSKTKKNIRKTVWKQKTNKNALKALSIAKSILSNPGDMKSDAKGFNRPVEAQTTESDSNPSS